LTIGVVAALVFALAARGSGDGGRPAVSTCGAVERQPRELGLGRARALTLCLLNEERARHGLAGLRQDGRLQVAAQRHSRDMVDRRFFEHDTPDGIDPQQRMLAAGYRSDNAFSGENIAWATGDKASPAAIVDLWMHSPPHREDILRPEFVDVGIGVALGAPAHARSTDPPVTYTTDFGGPPVR
jgi:uncharacterized protein YkwD